MARGTPSRSISGTVRPPRAANDRLRGGRKHLTEAEIEKLVAAARKHNRHGARDALAVTLAFRHGLRSATHYLNGTEMRALRALRRENDKSRFLFVSERGDVVTTRWFRNMVAKTGVLAGMPFPIHPHMLRHACGLQVCQRGQGHAQPAGLPRASQHPIHDRLPALAADRFKGWEAE